MKKTKLNIATAMLLAGLAGTAYAVDVDDYTLNFSDAGTVEGAVGLSNLQNVDEWKVTAYSVVGFHDNGDGKISKGDTFEDYILVRVDQFQDKFGTNITPSGYGTSYELTALLDFDGTQTGANTYTLTTQYQFDVLFDAGAGFTQAQTNASGSFSDGTVVEQLTKLEAGGVNSSPVLPDGTLDIVGRLTDVLSTLDCGGGPGSCGRFEFNFKDINGNPLNDYALTLGLVDANNNALYSSLAGNRLGAGFDGSTNPNLVNQATINTIANAFADLTYGGGNSASGRGGAFDFWFLTKSDGSFNKTIPEPATLLLLAAGLLGLGTSRRKGTV